MPKGSALMVASKVGAVIVAAGSSTRMELTDNSSKLDITLTNGRSVLEEAVCCVKPFVDKLVVVGRDVPGGDTRAASVKIGVEALATDVSRVLVHDAARPVVCAEDIQALLASDAKAVILARPVYSTIKKIGPRKNVEKTIDRSFLVESLTPQIFSREDLEVLYNQTSDFNYTDEASLFEKFGEEVQVVLTKNQVPKLTVPSDLALINSLLEQR